MQYKRNMKLPEDDMCLTHFHQKKYNFPLKNSYTCRTWSKGDLNHIKFTMNKICSSQSKANICTCRSRSCFCCSACKRPKALTNSPTVDSTRSVIASAKAFPKKNASKTALLSIFPENRTDFSMQKRVEKQFAAYSSKSWKLNHCSA